MKKEATPANDPPPTWIAKPMSARVNLADKEAVYRALDRRFDFLDVQSPLS